MDRSRDSSSGRGEQRSSVSRRVEGRGVRLYLHRLWMSYVEVLVGPLLEAVLGVLGDLSKAVLGGRGLEHHYLRVAVLALVVGSLHGPLDVSLCYLPQTRVRVRDSLVAMQAVALKGERALGRRLSGGHIRGGGG